jgi:hypothetical protein
MKPLKNLHNERGQGLMEYTLIIFLVTLAGSWSKVIDCITTPFSCGS